VQRVSARIAKPKFYLDESVNVWVADVLGRSQNVETAEDAKLLGRADEEHFAYCWRHGKVLVTHDFDFWNYRRSELPDTRNPGIIVLDCDSGDSESILRILKFLPRITDLVAERGWRHARIIASPSGFVRLRRRQRDTGAAAIELYRFSRHGAFERVDPNRGG
jgi:predicted nuclease of predicted toxin-antitoxin system